MTDLVEKVARAICEAQIRWRHPGLTEEQIPALVAEYWSRHTEEATAALAGIEAEGFVLTRPSMSSYTSDRVFDGTRQMSHDDAAKHIGRVNAMIEAGRIREDGK
jgi:hypothetical protein